MSKHTPGPWAVVEGTSIIIKPLNEWTSIRIGRADGQDAEANARLIAAAPDLLAELKEMREACKACFRVIHAAGTSAIDMLETELFLAGVREGFGARAADAIAKAEGTS